MARKKSHDDDDDNGLEREELDERELYAEEYGDDELERLDEMMEDYPEFDEYLDEDFAEYDDEDFYGEK